MYSVPLTLEELYHIALKCVINYCCTFALLDVDTLTALNNKWPRCDR
jgi:hypothetical protein